MTLLAALLAEKPVILVSPRASSVSFVAEAARQLLFPLQWKVRVAFVDLD